MIKGWPFEPMGGTIGIEGEGPGAGPGTPC